MKALCCLAFLLPSSCRHVSRFSPQHQLGPWPRRRRGAGEGGVRLHEETKKSGEGKGRKRRRKWERRKSWRKSFGTWRHFERPNKHTYINTYCQTTRDVLMTVKHLWHPLPPLDTHILHTPYNSILNSNPITFTRCQLCMAYLVAMAPAGSAQHTVHRESGERMLAEKKKRLEWGRMWGDLRWGG